MDEPGRDRTEPVTGPSEGLTSSYFNNSSPEELALSPRLTFLLPTL